MTSLLCWRDSRSLLCASFALSLALSSALGQTAPQNAILLTRPTGLRVGDSLTWRPTTPSPKLPSQIRLAVTTSSPLGFTATLAFGSEAAVLTLVPLFDAERPAQPGTNVRYITPFGLTPDEDADRDRYHLLRHEKVRLPDGSSSQCEVIEVVLPPRVELYVCPYIPLTGVVRARSGPVEFQLSGWTLGR